LESSKSPLCAQAVIRQLKALKTEIANAVGSALELRYRIADASAEDRSTKSVCIKLLVISRTEPVASP
jgi:hypothetical protein